MTITDVEVVKYIKRKIKPYRNRKISIEKIFIEKDGTVSIHDNVDLSYVSLVDIPFKFNFTSSFNIAGSTVLDLTFVPKRCVLLGHNLPAKIDLRNLALDSATVPTGDLFIPLLFTQCNEVLSKQKNHFPSIATELYEILNTGRNSDGYMDRSLIPGKINQLRDLK